MAKILIDSETGDPKQPGAILLEGEPKQIVLAVVIAMYASPEVAGIIQHAVAGYLESKRQGIDNPTKDINLALGKDAEKAYNNYKKRK